MYPYFDSDALIEFDLLVHADTAASAVVAVCRTHASLVVALLKAGVGHTTAPLAAAAAATVTSVVQLGVNRGRIFAAHATGVKPTGEGGPECKLMIYLSAFLSLAYPVTRCGLLNGTPYDDPDDDVDENEAFFRDSAAAAAAAAAGATLPKRVVVPCDRRLDLLLYLELGRDDLPTPEAVDSCSVSLTLLSAISFRPPFVFIPVFCHSSLIASAAPTGP